MSLPNKEPTEDYSAEWLRYVSRVHRKHRRDEKRYGDNIKTKTFIFFCEFVVIGLI
jgi:hypothetical protein